MGAAAAPFGVFEQILLRKHAHFARLRIANHGVHDHQRVHAVHLRQQVHASAAHFAEPRSAGGAAAAQLFKLAKAIFTDIWEMQIDFKEKVEEQFSAMIKKVLS